MRTREDLLVRPSDHDRERVVRALQASCADGRLSPATLEMRLERALRARCDSELRALTADVERLSRRADWLRRARRRRATPPAEPALWLAGIGSRPVTLGRSAMADLRVDHASVSRRHALVARTEHGYVLSDLASTNGTYLAGRRVGQIEVAAGDAVTLGTVTVRLL